MRRRLPLMERFGGYSVHAQKKARSRALRALFRGFESLERRDLLASVPLAFDDPRYTTATNTDLVISTTAAGIVSNDVDVDSSSLSASIVDNPAHGSLLSFNSNGTFTYRPNTGFSGFDSFTGVTELPQGCPREAGKARKSGVNETRPPCHD